MREGNVSNLNSSFYIEFDVLGQYKTMPRAREKTLKDRKTHPTSWHTKQDSSVAAVQKVLQDGSQNISEQNMDWTTKIRETWRLYSSFNV